MPCMHSKLTIIIPPPSRFETLYDDTRNLDIVVAFAVSIAVAVAVTLAVAFVVWYEILRLHVDHDSATTRLLGPPR